MTSKKKSPVKKRGSSLSDKEEIKLIYEQLKQLDNESKKTKSKSGVSNDSKTKLKKDVSRSKKTVTDIRVDVINKRNIDNKRISKSKKKTEVKPEKKIKSSEVVLKKSTRKKLKEVWNKETKTFETKKVSVNDVQFYDKKGKRLSKKKVKEDLKMSENEITHLKHNTTFKHPDINKYFQYIQKAKFFSELIPYMELDKIKGYKKYLYNGKSIDFDKLVLNIFSYASEVEAVRQFYRFSINVNFDKDEIDIRLRNEIKDIAKKGKQNSYTDGNGNFILFSTN